MHITLADNRGRSAPVSIRRRVVFLLMVGLLLAPLLWTQSTPAQAATVTYSYGSDTEQTIDVTTPAGVRAGPWVMLVHGGSWAAGSKTTMLRAARVFSAAGFVVVNLEYRKVSDYVGNPGVVWSQQRQDVLTALTWVRQHATEVGADPTRGALYGYSAGGHIAASAGLYGQGRTRVRAIVSVSGPLQPHRLANVADADPRVGHGGDKPTTGVRTLARWAAVAMRCPNLAWESCSGRWKDFLPETHIGTNDPPMMIFQGSADTSVPPATGRAFRYWMQRGGLEARLIECIRWSHTESCALDGGWRQRDMIAWLRAKTTAA